jgi:hypothetical protein
MHSHSFADYVVCLDCGDLQGVGQLMLSSAGKLASIGADFLIAPTTPSIRRSVMWSRCLPGPGCILPR